MKFIYTALSRRFVTRLLIFGFALIAIQCGPTLLAQTVAGTCYDNGTPNNINDDVIQFTYNPQNCGINSATFLGYPVDGDGSNTESGLELWRVNGDGTETFVNAQGANAAPNGTTTFRLRRADGTGTVNVGNSFVRFITSTFSANCYLEVTYSGGFCSTPPPDPMDVPVIGIPCYVNGDRTQTATGSDEAFLMVQYAPNQGSNALQPDNSGIFVLASDDQIGSTWGVAYNNTTSTFYTSATIKRHADIGPNGTGAIYRIPATITAGQPAGTPTLLIDLNADANINTGSVLTAAQRGLTTAGSPSVDPSTFDQAGRIALGDIELSPDRQTLYAISVNDNQLITINVGSETGTSTAALSSAAISGRLAINAATTGLSTAGGEIIPWGLGVDQATGAVYVGVVTNAQTSGNIGDLNGYVFRVDGSTLTQVLNFNFGYQRNGGVSVEYSAQWQPWTTGNSTYTFLPPPTGANFFQQYPQPLVSDIEILDDGSMLIGMVDRFGLQTGSQNSTVDGSTTQSAGSDATNGENGRPAGDVILFAPAGNGTWSGAIDPHTCGSPNTADETDGCTDLTNSFGDFFSTLENAAALGSVAYLRGQNDPTTLTGDEFVGPGVDPTGPNQNGIGVLSLTNPPVLLDNQNVVDAGSQPRIAAKGLALGDLELGILNASCVITDAGVECTGSGAGGTTITVNPLRETPGVLNSYTVSVAGRTVSDGTDNVGAYGSATTFTITPALQFGESVAVVITDNDVNTCTATETISAADCGVVVTCSITGTIDSETCNPGDQNSETDDTYTILVTATLTNGTSPNYEVLVNGAPLTPTVVAASGTQAAIVLPATAGPSTAQISFRDVNDQTCSSSPVLVTGDLMECSTPGNPTDGVTCDCTDYVYLNDEFAGLTHKFGTNTGQLVEVDGDPGTAGTQSWLDWSEIGFTITVNGNQTIADASPHGLGIDPNGFIYIANFLFNSIDNLGGEYGIYKFNCEAESQTAGMEPFIDTGFSSGSSQNSSTGTNFISDGNFLIRNPPGARELFVSQFCDDGGMPVADVGQIQYSDPNSISDNWGLVAGEDGLHYSTVRTINSEVLVYRWDPATIDYTSTTNLISNPLDLTPLIQPVLAGNDLSVQGIDADAAGNMYIFVRGNTGNTPSEGTSGVFKIDSTGTMILASVLTPNAPTNPLPAGQANIGYGRGLVYDPALNKVYVAGGNNLTGNSFPDCIAVLDGGNLSYLPNESVPYVSGQAPKGIAMATECCASGTEVIDQTVCDASNGDVLFLQEFTGCDGSVCDGAFVVVGNLTGLTFDDCNNTVTVTDAANACGTFTLTKAAEPGASCPLALNLTINLEFGNPAPVTITSSDEAVCLGDTPALLTATAPAAAQYQWQVSTTSATTGFTDVAGANAATYQPPVFTAESYYRVITTVDGACVGASMICADTSNVITLSEETNCTDPVCAITEISTAPGDCDPATNTYEAVVTVTFNDALGGVLRVTVDGQQATITDPTSPQAITVTGLISDGQLKDVTAVFDDDPGCTLTAIDNFMAPEDCTPDCAITAISTAPGDCDPATNTYEAVVTVTFNDALGGVLRVTVDGQQATITDPTSPQAITVTGLTSDGLLKDVTAVFDDDPGCTLTATANFTAPEGCTACSITATITAGACDDNGTPSDPSDDTFTLFARGMFSGTNSGSFQAFYSTDGFATETPFPGTFADGFTASVAGLPSDGTTTYEVRVQDAADATCSNTAGPVTAPESCSDECQFDIQLLDPSICSQMMYDLRVTVGYANPTSDMVDVVINGTTYGPFSLSANDADGDMVAEFTVTDLPCGMGESDFEVAIGTDASCNAEGDFFAAPIDPAGYIYCVENGKIIPGGMITVTYENTGLSTSVTAGTIVFGTNDDGTTNNGMKGSYDWEVLEGGPYSQMYTAPSGYTVVTDQIEPADGAEGTLDPTGEEDPFSVGSAASGDGTNFTRLLDFSDEGNTYFQRFDLQVADPFIINNNIPLMSSAMISGVTAVAGDCVMDGNTAGTSEVTVTVTYANVPVGETMELIALNGTPLTGNVMEAVISDGTGTQDFVFSFASDASTVDFTARFAVTDCSTTSADGQVLLPASCCPVVDPLTICADGTTSVTLTAPADVDPATVEWFDEAGTSVGTGATLEVTAALVAAGLDGDATEAFTYTGNEVVADGDFACPITLCCPIVVQTIACLQLGSTVFIDGNNNGVQDAGETGIANVPLILLDGNGAPIDIGADGLLGTADDGLGQVYMTDGSGNYLFGNLAPGDYSVRIPASAFDPAGPLANFPISSNATTSGFMEVDPDGTDLTSPADDTDGDDNGLQPGGSGTVVTTDPITLSVGDEPTTTETFQGGTQDDTPADANGNMTLDLSFFAPVTVGDTAFVDVNMDGLQDAGDQPLTGATVTIIDVATGLPVDTDANGMAYTSTQTTGSMGEYLFENLPPGNYRVTFDISTIDNAEFFVYTTPNQGGDSNDAIDSDITPATPEATTGTTGETGFLSSGESDLTLDAGVVCNISVTVAPPATLCATRNIDLTVGASVTPDGLGGVWSSSGDGTFDGGTAFPGATTYTPGAQDILNGEVTLTLTSNAAPVETGCQPASASVTFTILNVDCGAFFWDGGN